MPENPIMLKKQASREVADTPVLPPTPTPHVPSSSSVENSSLEQHKSQVEQDHWLLAGAMETRTAQISDQLPTLDTGQVPALRGEGLFAPETLAAFNDLLHTGMLHCFIKVGHVTAKVREVVLSPHDETVLECLVADQDNAIRIICDWHTAFVLYFGHRRWLW